MHFDEWMNSEYYSGGIEGDVGDVCAGKCIEGLRSHYLRDNSCTAEDRDNVTYQKPTLFYANMLAPPSVLHRHFCHLCPASCFHKCYTL